MSTLSTLVPAGVFTAIGRDIAVLPAIEGEGDIMPFPDFKEVINRFREEFFNAPRNRTLDDLQNWVYMYFVDCDKYAEEFFLDVGEPSEQVQTLVLNFMEVFCSGTKAMEQWVREKVPKKFDPCLNMWLLVEDYFYDDEGGYIDGDLRGLFTVFFSEDTFEEIKPSDPGVNFLRFLEPIILMANKLWNQTCDNLGGTQYGDMFDELYVNIRKLTDPSHFSNEASEE